MFPVFDDMTAARTPQSIAARLFAVALATIFSAGIALMFIPDVGDTPVMRVIFALASIGIAVSVMVMVAARLSKPKSKHGLDGLDMYSVIDRMVADLDEDEAAYLRRRLDEREAKKKDDLTVSLDELLDQRAQDRQSSRE